MTYIVNYGMAQTEPFRTGILNTYVLVFTSGDPPSKAIDTRWFAGMGLTGYVTAAGRGSVACQGIDGRDPKHTYTIGFANSKAQYYITARAADGALHSHGHAAWRV